MIVNNINRIRKASCFCIALSSAGMPLSTQASSLTHFEDPSSEMKLTSFNIAKLPAPPHPSLNGKDEDKVESGQPISYNLVGVALFSGTDVISGLIKLLTGSKVSHVGLILSDAKSEDKNAWYCFESTGSASDVLHGIYPHVGLSSWKDSVDSYKGKVSYRLIEFKEERVDSKLVTDLVLEHDGKSYTKNPLKLLKALFHANKKTYKRHKTYFCSELVTSMLIDLGLLRKRIDSNTLPKHYEDANRGLQLSSDVALTPAFHEK